MELQEEFERRKIDLPIVFITGHGDIPMSVRAMKKGAIDFLSKPFDDEALIDAINRAIRKDRKIKKHQGEVNIIQQRLNILTPREYEVLRWVITGKLNKQIAYELGITEKTVKVHRARVMKKMQVISVAELVRLAEKAGVTTPKV